jgi:hypothetical protein
MKYAIMIALAGGMILGIIGLLIQWFVLKLINW